MSEKVDSLELDNYYSSDYLKKSGELSARSVGVLYDFKLRLDKQAGDGDVKRWDIGNYNDESLVFQVKKKGDVSAKINTHGAAASAFGEVVASQYETHVAWSFSYNISPVQVVSILNGSGTVTHSGSFGVISTGTDADGAAAIRTLGCLNYAPGIGGVARFTCIFSEPKENSTQIVGLGDSYDGWFFGYDGLKFGIMRRKESIDTWTYQSSWSEDPRVDLVPTKGNVYEIKYEWLGFGSQYFGIENINGDIETVHRIAYSNLETDTSTAIPSLPIYASVENNGNTSDIIVKTPSASAGSHGESFPVSLTAPVGYNLEKSIDAGSFDYLFGLYMPLTWFGKPNRSYFDVPILSIATEGNKAVTFRIKLGAVLTAANLAEISPGVSPIQVDTEATAVTGGIEVVEFTLGKIDNNTIPLEQFFPAKIWAGSTVTIEALTASISTVTVAVTMRSRI